MIEIDEKNLVPVGDNLMVKPLSPEGKTKAGIIIPESVKNAPLIGEVLAVGPGRLTENGKLLPMPIKTGMTVFYNRYAGSEIKTSREYTILLMSLDDVLAVVN